jgi:hypothetical protein
MADDGDLCALLCRNDGRAETHYTGGAENRDASIFQAAFEFLLQRLFDLGDHCSRGGEGAGRISEDGNLEGRHHRLLGRIEHVEGERDVLAGYEDAGIDAGVRRAGEDRILDEAGHFADAHADIGHDGVEAGVQRHVHVEWAHVSQRGQHVQDVLAGHFPLQTRRRPAEFRCRRDRARSS